MAGTPRSFQLAAIRRRVLIVDDNQDAATMLADSLLLYGHDVRWANDGPTALDLARTFAPEVALLDLGLPVMDGYELARRFAEDPDLRRTRVVAVTGTDRTGTVTDPARPASRRTGQAGGSGSRASDCRRGR